MRANDDGKIVVGKCENMPPGSVTMVPVGRYGIGVFNVAGRYFALLNYCLHRGAPLCQGVVTGHAVQRERPYELCWEREGEIIRCPWHGWEFDITDGRSLAHPHLKTRTYPVLIENDEVVLQLRRVDASETMPADLDVERE